MMVCTLSDINWIMEKADLWYAGTMDDRDSAKEWVKSLIESPNSIIMRTERAMAAAEVGKCVFAPEMTGCFHFFGGNIWDLVKIMRLIMAWGKEKKATNLTFSSIMGPKVKVHVLAKRLGAIPVPTYMTEA